MLYCLAPTQASCTHFLLFHIPEWNHFLDTTFVLMAADSIQEALRLAGHDGFLTGCSLISNPSVDG
jgi:hypothetical protein